MNDGGKQARINEQIRLRALRKLREEGQRISEEERKNESKD